MAIQGLHNGCNKRVEQRDCTRYIRPESGKEKLRKSKPNHPVSSLVSMLRVMLTCTDVHGFCLCHASGVDGQAERMLTVRSCSAVIGPGSGAIFMHAKWLATSFPSSGFGGGGAICGGKNTSTNAFMLARQRLLRLNCLSDVCMLASSRLL